MIKSIINYIAAVMVCCIFTSCASPDGTVSPTAQKWRDTLKFAADKAFTIATQTVLQGAVSSKDWNTRADWVQGLEGALYANTGKVLSWNDIVTVVKIWTPDKPIYSNLAQEIADLYTKLHPTSVEKSDAVIAGIASGLGSIR